MKIQIYILYGLVAAVAICQLYTILICKQRLGDVEQACERRVKHVKDIAPIVEDIDRTISSLIACNSPGNHCEDCCVTSDDDLQCIAYLARRAVAQLEDYKELITNG